MAAILKGREVTRQGVADIFGVSLPTVDSWVRAGCPYNQKGGRGQEWQFNTSQIAKWLQERAVDNASSAIPDDMEELKLREQKAKTVMAELELAKSTGEVALISEFEKVQSKIFSIIRTNMMNVPQRVVLQLLGEKDASKFKQILRAEIIRALESAVDFEIAEEDDHQ